MRKLTEKQNYMMLLRGEQPEWVPRYTFAPDPDGTPVAACTVGPALLLSHFTDPGPSRDIWGVTHIPVPEAGGTKMPEPNHFILKDIRKWRDVIRAPDLEGIDWEAMAKKDINELRVSRENTALVLSIMAEPFLKLVAFMGFSEGLCAMYEEPEEVTALLEYVTDFTMEVGEKCIDHYKPDIFGIADDTATWKNPFFSPGMYRELIKPHHARMARLATERGIPVEMHCCGRCEDFIDDWLDFGVVSWNPAQTSNDLAEIKRKYGRGLVINGGWDSAAALQAPDVSEMAVKLSVRDSIDRYAPGGGYAFTGGFLGPLDDGITNRKNRWISEEVRSYGADFYRR
ncbi:MAG: veratrol--corrinoid protein metyltransferase [Defluviitaleaceae bacterium]|nr:veratrol--corrinoid protein metyltransferase [Defluviitaleaceae bacterium]